MHITFRNSFFIFILFFLMPNGRPVFAVARAHPVAWGFAGHVACAHGVV